jgi:hypothetical protein
MEALCSSETLISTYKSTRSYNQEDQHQQKLKEAVGLCIHLWKPPYVMVEQLIFLLRIWEVPGSNLGLETCYPHRGFCGFPQSLQANSGIVGLP